MKTCTAEERWRNPVGPSSYVTPAGASRGLPSRINGMTTHLYLAKPMVGHVLYPSPPPSGSNYYYYILRSNNVGRLDSTIYFILFLLRYIVLCFVSVLSFASEPYQTTSRYIPYIWETVVVCRMYHILWHMPTSAQSEKTTKTREVSC